MVHMVYHFESIKFICYKKVELLPFSLKMFIMTFTQNNTIMLYEVLFNIKKNYFNKVNIYIYCK